MNQFVKFFVVDDEQLIRKLLASHLQKFANIEVITFSSGEECIENLDKKPSVILLDYYLNHSIENDKEGLLILKKIKEIIPDTKVIIVSGENDSKLIYELINNGADNYIIKDMNVLHRLDLVLCEEFPQLYES